MSDFDASDLREALIDIRERILIWDEDRRAGLITTKTSLSSALARVDRVLSRKDDCGDSAGRISTEAA